MYTLNFECAGAHMPFIQDLFLQILNAKNSCHMILFQNSLKRVEAGLGP